MSLRSIVAVVILSCAPFQAQNFSYLGFDRNDYPGDANLKSLHQTCSYTGYWLNDPPGEKTNTWTGHRAAVESAGFGFLVLFNGRLYADLKSVIHAQKLGNSDAQAAVASARREGFPAHTIIFLDQEQGGRMLPEQKAYIYAWVDAVTAAGFRPGVYCSGIPAKDDGNIVTAEDIRQNAGARHIVYWAINDACPPAPGCAFPARPPSPAESGVRFAEIWQFAQSPQRKDVAGRCSNYSRDGNCYPPGMAAARQLHVDLNTATSPDPSRGRTR
ncbi:MAG: glycoside hydrolase domain-containing protein [Candidatus Sulfotelmatobacter sp.]